MTINKELSNIAIQKGKEFIKRNILPWGEIPTFKIDNGVEQSYTYMPITTAYYLNTVPTSSMENTTSVNFINNLLKPTDCNFETKHLHPEIDTNIKLQCIYYNNVNLKSGLSQDEMEINYNELGTEVKFIDDVAIELNFMELKSIANIELFNENIKNLDFNNLLKKRSLFYNSKYFHFYQLSKMFTESLIKKESINIDESYIKASIQDFESIFLCIDTIECP